MIRRKTHITFVWPQISNHVSFNPIDLDSLSHSCKYSIQNIKLDETPSTRWFIKCGCHGYTSDM